MLVWWILFIDNTLAWRVEEESVAEIHADQQNSMKLNFKSCQCETRLCHSRLWSTSLVRSLCGQLFFTILSNLVRLIFFNDTCIRSIWFHLIFFVLLFDFQNVYMEFDFKFRGYFWILKFRIFCFCVYFGVSFFYLYYYYWLWKYLVIFLEHLDNCCKCWVSFK